MAIIMQHKIHVVLIKYKDGKTVTIMGKYNSIISNKIRHRFQSLGVIQSTDRVK
jgi:hypothetical protein